MPPDPSAVSGSPAFHTTRWTLVVHAGQDESRIASSALAELCRAYWPPLYAYVRRRGHPPHDAQDLTQAFFARLLEHHWVKRADPSKGRFRTFLLTALQRFLSDEWDKARAAKRGGSQPIVSLDELENAYQTHASSTLSADRLYDRSWALKLLEHTLDRLESEFALTGRRDEFEALKPFLTASREDIHYADIAQTTGLSEGAARVAVHRLRKRYRELFREEIARTLTSSDDIDAELRHLIQALSEG